VLRGGRLLDPPSRTALARVLASPVWEVLPLESTRAHARTLPAGAQVSVTASPSKPIETTIGLAAELQAAGLRAVPHVSARMIRDRAHLGELMHRIVDAGIVEVFVVGGDAAEPGQYPDGLALLRAMAEIGHDLRLGIPGYPDGHAFIPPHRLLDALVAKAPFASYLTTQLCFDAGAITRWIAARRADGLELPVVLGIPGAVEPHRLLAVSARIGVRDTKAFVRKNVGLVGRLVRSGGFYRPDGLLAGLAATIANPRAGVQGLHIYTFNQVEASVAWRTAYLSRIEPVEAA